MKTLTSTILTSHPGVSLEVLNEFYGRTADQLHLTVREIIGLDAHAIEEHFKQFLHAHPSLTAQQVRFMNLLKNYIAQHGSIVIETLYDAPFSSISTRASTACSLPPMSPSWWPCSNLFEEPRPPRRTRLMAAQPTDRDD